MAAEHRDGWGERMMALVWRKPAETVGERCRRRITVHVLPFLFFLYILAYLDRFNVSVAALGMKLSDKERGLGFTDDIIGHGAGMFFWGYWILEMPSTISVAKWGARWVFARILVLWGICAAVCGLIGLPMMSSWFGWLPELNAEGGGFFAPVANYVNHLHDSPSYQFYFFRFMLGFFEGGFFPTVIVYLSYWFRPQDRAKAIACFMAAIPFSGAVGIPISGLLLNVDWAGLVGWRWVFITEGVLPILAGVATVFLLPNRPQEAKWLPDEEREWLNNELEEEHRSKQGHGHGAWVHHLGMVVLLTLVYFGLNMSSYGLSMFMPAIIKSQTGASDLVATMISGFYYTVAVVAMLFNGWHSDKTNERIWHVSIPLAVQGVAIYLAATLEGVPFLPIVIIVTFVAATQYAYLPAFWPIPTMFLGAIAAASAIGFINMIGNLGGYFGPTTVGKAVTEDINWLKDFVGKDVTINGAAARFTAELQAANDVKSIQAVRDRNVQTRVTDDDLRKLDEFAASLAKSGKLPVDQTIATAQLLARVALRAPLTEQEQKQLTAVAESKEQSDWLTGLMKPESKQPPLSGDGAALESALASAESIEAVQKIRQTDWSKRLSVKEITRILSIENNLISAGKLSDEDLRKVLHFLARAALRDPIMVSEKNEVVPLMGRGASFASGLKALAPWPIMSAVIILVVGFLRRGRGTVPA